MTDLVVINQGKPCTTSRKIASKFGKEHKNVLRSIETLECSNEFNQLNFEPVDYMDAKGEKRPEYLITRDGFSFLIMGFTGREAAKFKEEFINAFNKN
jgi:Rha family phage regulatory protein